jgi:hypothetical protein
MTVFMAMSPEWPMKLPILPGILPPKHLMRQYAVDHAKLVGSTGAQQTCIISLETQINCHMISGTSGLFELVVQTLEGVY